MSATPSSMPVGSEGPAGAAPPAPPVQGRGAPYLLRPLLGAAGRVRRHPGRSLAVVGLLALIGAGVAAAGTQFWASYHYRAARNALQRYHNQEAVEHLSACMEVWPNDPDVLLLAARAARRTGQFDSAEELLERCRQRRGRDDTLTLERILLSVERGEGDDVSKYCTTKVEANDPDSPLVIEAMVRGFLYQFRVDQAAEMVAVWEQRDPNNPVVQLLRGRVAQDREGDYDAAVAFRRALELDPELDEARDRLAMVLVRMNQGAEALPHLEYLARRRPDDAGLAVRLAVCRDLLGQQEEAMRLLDGVLARNPDYLPALAERGKIALRAGERAEAEFWLRKAVALAPGDATVLSPLQVCLEQTGQTEEARALKERVKKAEDDRARLQHLLYSDLQHSPRNADLWYEVGTILTRAGSDAEGLRCLENAVRYQPRHAKAHEALADLYSRHGDMVRAAKHQKLAREAGARAEGVRARRRKPLAA